MDRLTNMHIANVGEEIDPQGTAGASLRAFRAAVKRSNESAKESGQQNPPQEPSSKTAKSGCFLTVPRDVTKRLVGNVRFRLVD